MQWVVFLEDYSVVDLKLLMKVLKKYNHNKDIWIGHALYDAEAVIIHHFEFRENPESFKYPNLASGFAMSLPLLEKVRMNAKNESKKPQHPRDFHIDPAHELALFILDDGTGAKLRHNSLFCAKKDERDSCAIYPKEFEPCGEADISTMYFAIKTCRYFYKDRIDVVKKTYYKYTEKSGFFSDHEDKDIPTIDVGIPNVDRGHCAKMMAILQLSLKKFQNDTKLEWLILVDDDTILSVSRIAGLLSCHNSSEPMILGERYGYGKRGMDYPTGGAGTLINRSALEILAYGCHCAWPSAPDDMMLGACAEEYDITIVHVPQMHQARPNDYAPGRLATNDAITFHKHWNNRPVEIYNQWFLKDDQKLSKHHGKFNLKDEL
ncbi:beta-1,3-glucosyltransferase isoform X2 [Anthonomus grandis grandis]|nr:beta-1,3-glucosyltransferase isoform X2 [Anthonomus grandis grandis]